MSTVEAGEELGEAVSSPLKETTEIAATKPDEAPQTDSKQPLPFKVDGNTVCACPWAVLVRIVKPCDFAKKYST